ncbi:MAG: T9SS type A sorting domain-containing protein [Ignavibacteria bacterium]|nr:T9SS type A sorting domain-containing protein [Ignavibacteria bacterium]
MTINELYNTNFLNTNNGGNLIAGNYEASFDGSNLTSGVYFYRLQANGFTETKRMTLIK